jgi:uncharacterized phage-associated protein
MQDTHSSAAVANAFLELAKGEGINLSNMQLQKLVFFAHGVHLAAYSSPLIHEHPKAWTFGPVIPQLYEALRRYGSDTVTESLSAHDAVESTGTAIQAIQATWHAYKKYSASQMSKISHIKGGPWDQVWNDAGGKGRFEVIPDHVIKDYYSSRVRKPVSA